MRIRRATFDDLPVIRDVTVRAYDVYEILLGYLPAAAHAPYEDWVQRGHAWVGERDSTIMAVLLARPLPAHVLVWSAVVDPDWQGEGHGRALLEHAEALAREARLPELRLSTNALMDRTISLYRHCGYCVQGRRKHPEFPEHELVDMVKPVSLVAAAH